MSNKATAVSDRSWTAEDRVRTGARPWRASAPRSDGILWIRRTTPAGSWSGTG